MLPVLILLPVCLSLTHAQSSEWSSQNSWAARQRTSGLQTARRHKTAETHSDVARIPRPPTLRPDANRPRRGRIVARIHSSDLSIPALHSHYINNKQPTHTFPKFAECSTLCPPQWMTFVNNLRGITDNVTDPMCAFTQQFSACSVENEVCRTEPVAFRCCPSHCVQSAMACYSGPPTDFLCVPKTIQPWMRTMAQLFALG